MKNRTTAKEVKRYYGYVISVPYCDLQDLLNNLDATAYTCGVYGWNSDIYECGGVAISTGYRPVSGIHPNRETTAKFNRKAASLRKRCKSWEAIQRTMNRLLREFVNEVLTEAGER